MIGTSVYLSTFNKEQLEMYTRNNAKYIFTSLHIPEEEIDLNKVKELLTIAEQQDINLIVDVSPNTLNVLEIENILDLKEIGFKVIRLDYGFDDLVNVKALSEEFTLVLNASVITPAYVNTLEELNIDISKIKALHNFYPKVNSGLDKETIVKKNNELSTLGIEAYAFISGDLEYRMPTFDGLVTLEKHRGLDSYCAAIELLEDCFVSGVFIGDGQVSERLLKKLMRYDRDKSVIEIRATLNEEYSYLYDQEIVKRVDSNSRVIRLQTRAETEVEQENCLMRIKGTISITNSNYGRYKNEIEICNEDLGFDNRFNTIGMVYQQDYTLLDMLDNAEKIIFRRI